MLLQLKMMYESIISAQKAAYYYIVDSTYNNLNNTTKNIIARYNYVLYETDNCNIYSLYLFSKAYYKTQI